VKPLCVAVRREGIRAHRDHGLRGREGAGAQAATGAPTSIDDISASEFGECWPSTRFGRGDGNASDAADIADAVRTLRHLSAHTGSLPAPLGQCGIDPTADTLSCEEYAPCT